MRHAEGFGGHPTNHTPKVLQVTTLLSCQHLLQHLNWHRQVRKWPSLFLLDPLNQIHGSKLKGGKLHRLEKLQ